MKGGAMAAATKQSFKADESIKIDGLGCDRLPLSAALTVKEFLLWARISRSTFYREVRSGRITLRKVGKRSLVLRADAEAWLRNLPNAE